VFATMEDGLAGKIFFLLPEKREKDSVPGVRCRAGEINRGRERGKWRLHGRL